jgi:hypothetical protein
MAPPSWATTEQLKFLRGYMPIFADYTANETQSKFWPRLNEEWFRRWPELNVLIKDGKLPPGASASDPDVPGDPRGESTKYQMTLEERALYGAAIEARKQVSAPALSKNITHQHIFLAETAELDPKQ